MELNNAQKLSKHIFRLLKVNEISFPIGRTNKGNLTIVFNESKDDFDLFLDSVPLPTKSLLEDDKNIELKQMVEKYWFDGHTINGSQFRGTSLESKGPFNVKTVSIEDSEQIISPSVAFSGIDSFPTNEVKKPRGRPAGAKNKK